MLVSGPGVLVVHPSLPARSVKELIAVAKSRPGELLYASPGNGTPPHLAAELFKSMAGINIVHVPYKGNAQAMTDLIAGQESLSFPTGPSAMPHVQAKRLRALGVTTAKRAAGLPDIPTIAESGLPGYDASAWYGVLAPAARRPRSLRNCRVKFISRCAAPDIVDKLSAQGLEPAPNNADEFARFIAAELREVEQDHRCRRHQSGVISNGIDDRGLTAPTISGAVAATRAPLRHYRQEDIRRENYEVHDALQQGRAAERERQHAHPERQREQHELRPARCRGSTAARKPDRHHRDYRDRQADAGERRSQREIELVCRRVRGGCANRGTNPSGIKTSMAMATPTALSGRIHRLQCAFDRRADIQRDRRLPVRARAGAACRWRMPPGSAGGAA